MTDFGRARYAAATRLLQTGLSQRCYRWPEQGVCLGRRFLGFAGRSAGKSFVAIATAPKGGDPKGLRLARNL